MAGKVLVKAASEGGQQFLQRMAKANTLPKLSGIVTDDLVKHIDTVKSADEIANIPNLTKKELKEICEEIDEINNDK